MKKLILLLSTFALFFTSCGTRRTVEQDPATFDEGVVINGVRWATRNVNSPGTFTANPYHAGRLFTFHEAQNACPRGWRLPTREELQSLADTDSEWVRDGRFFGTTPNRLFFPSTTREELQSLADADPGEWVHRVDSSTLYNLFFSANTRIHRAIFVAGSNGWFWSGTMGSGTEAASDLPRHVRHVHIPGINNITFRSSINPLNRFNGFTVRCVADIN